MHPTAPNEFYSDAYIAKARAIEAVVMCLQAHTKPDASTTYGHCKVRHGSSWDCADDWHWHGEPGVTLGGPTLYPTTGLTDALVVAGLLGISVEIIPGELVKAVLGDISAVVAVTTADQHPGPAVCKALQIIVDEKLKRV